MHVIHAMIFVDDLKEKKIKNLVQLNDVKRLYFFSSKHFWSYHIFNVEQIQGY